MGLHEIWPNRRHTGTWAPTTCSPKSGTLATRFFELQSGMIAALYDGDGLSEIRADVINDSSYIHFSYLVNGAVMVKVKGQVITAAIGEGHLVFAPGEHFNIALSPSYRRVDLMVKPEALSEIAGIECEDAGVALNRNFALRALRPGQKIVNAAFQLAERLDHGRHEKLLLQSAALEFLGWNLNAVREEKRDEPITPRDRQRLFVARDRLLHDLSNPPTIAELASETGLNQLKLKRGFKALFETSVYALFQEYRMERARHLLQDHTVTETAAILGYSNFSHFSTAYRKQFGVLPREERKRNVS